ncbi:hypothetical protein WUBG_04781 [Wuchereria bancrofti]|uniref:Uncharacterized protein n=1 Tax=Wuchereria bancrofti TaxID=6293 RepID=J9EQ28_WUCBA|nr:hypothetical protein WUBG_04781 [Wuchereria bancrofti]
MAGNFDAEALVLIVLTYITLIIVLLRIALALCQFTIKKEIDRAKQIVNVTVTQFETYPSVTQSHQKGVNDDESFWLHSFEESELSRENANVPYTSAYGMRKVGKKTYIDDTNIGSPGSKALEQKSCEHIEKENATQ